MRLWYPPARPGLKVNLRAFDQFMRANPDFQYYHPNYKESPWHVHGRSARGTIVNFWPHLLKGNIPGKTGVVGREELDRLLNIVRTMDRVDEETTPARLIEDD